MAVSNEANAESIRFQIDHRSAATAYADGVLPTPADLFDSPIADLRM